jgi:hypothetical protein
MNLKKTILILSLTIREEGDRCSSKVDKAINDEEKPNVQMRLKFFFLRNHLDAL